MSTKNLTPIEADKIAVNETAISALPGWERLTETNQAEIIEEVEVYIKSRLARQGDPEAVAWKQEQDTKWAARLKAEKAAAPALPVAPEFVETLMLDTVEVLKDCLEKLNAPKDVTALVSDINSLAYYLLECYRAPETLTGENCFFDGKQEVLETVNHIAAVGGTFEGKGGGTYPRKGTLLAEAEKVTA